MGFGIWLVLVDRIDAHERGRARLQNARSLLQRPMDRREAAI
jgi:hypothetical protein